MKVMLLIFGLMISSVSPGQITKGGGGEYYLKAPFPPELSRDVSFQEQIMIKLAKFGFASYNSKVTSYQHASQELNTLINTNLSKCVDSITASKSLKDTYSQLINREMIEAILYPISSKDYLCKESTFASCVYTDELRSKISDFISDSENEFLFSSEVNNKEQSEVMIKHMRLIKKK